MGSFRRMERKAGEWGTRSMIMMGLTRAGRVGGVVAGLALAAATALGAEIRLTGAGATFPAPLYKKWVVEFEGTPAGKEVKIDYNSIGSGGGVKAITDKTVAFGASD